MARNRRLAIDYFNSVASDWTAEEIDFVNWVFNREPDLKQCADVIALHEGMTYERYAKKGAP
jgi:hypothetical protein